MKAKIDINAPVTLTICALSVLAFFVQLVGGDSFPLFVLPSEFDFSRAMDYVNLFLYPFGHVDAAHLMGNLTFILLLGPILEEKYGKATIIGAILVTTIIAALVHIALFHKTGLMGASGIVFMYIILASFVNVRKGTIPLTFILVGVIFIGREIVDTFHDDRVSQFTHIIGGLVGAYVGFKLTPKKQEEVHQEEKENLLED